MLDNANQVFQWCADNNYKAYQLKEKTLLVSAEMIAPGEDAICCYYLLANLFPEILLEINQNDPTKK